MKPSNDNSRTFELESGWLELEIEREDWPFEQLLGVGVRRNPKRGFLFVSKVLGKHVPARPSEIISAQRALAMSLSPTLPGPVAVIGLAETATALGYGVFARYLETTQRTDLVFLHSTRYLVGEHIDKGGAVLEFQEPHSHATHHLLHLPTGGEAEKRFANARTLILVDDELSTGKTLLNLAQTVRARNNALERVIFLSLVGWLSSETKNELANALGLPITYVNLLEGHYKFVPNTAFVPPETPSAVGTAGSRSLRVNAGRLGLTEAFKIRPRGFEVAKTDERILVLGTMEFSAPPLEFAAELENLGFDVMYQSTTRSPILLGHEIRQAFRFADHYGDEIPNYLYNASPGDFDRVFVGIETETKPNELLRHLNATALVWE